jgi:hypothetical protein
MARSEIVCAVLFVVLHVRAMSAERIAWWRFEGDFQDSANTHHGTGKGPMSFVTGLPDFGQAAHFDGKSSIEVIDAPDLSAMPEYMIEAWIRPESKEVHGGIISKFGTGPASDDEFALTYANGGINYEVCSGLGDVTWSIRADMEEGEWHHILTSFSHSRKTMKVLIDGIPAGSIPANLSRLSDTIEPVKIGLFTYGYRDPPRYFEGEIDELVIWKGTPPVFRRGDVDQDGRLNITDPIFLLDHLFKGGTIPECLDAADADDNGKLEINDAIGLLNNLFQSGMSPVYSLSVCAVDTTDDDLGCETGCFR